MKRFSIHWWFCISLVVSLFFVPGSRVLQAKGDDGRQIRMVLAEKLMQSDGLPKVQIQILATMAKQITGAIVKKHPSKEKQIRRLMDEIFGEMDAKRNEMNKKIASVYAKHFTVDEMKTLLAFRQTPLGRKMEVKMPVIMQEAMRVGQLWGRDIALDIMRRFMEEAKKRGLEL
jgi:hypothetical protein